MPPAKKSVRKARSVSKMTVEPVMPVVAPTTPLSTPHPRMSKKFLTLTLVVILIALITYKFGPYLVPAIVGGKPITRFAIWSKLEQSYGTETLDNMVNEAILSHAIAKSGVKIEQSAIDAQMATLDKQFESLGGLDEALKQRGLTKAELEEQVRTQLSVEKILADKVSVSDEDIQKEYDANKTTLYKDKKLEDARDSIASSLKDSKLREAFLTWFADVKTQAKVKNFGL